MRNFLIFIVILGLIGYFGSKWYMHNEVSKGMDMAILMMSPYAKVDYDGVDSTLTGELTIEGLRVRVNGYSDDLYIDSLGIDTPSIFSLMELGEVVQMQSRDFPEYFGFMINGLQVPVDADYFQDLYGFMLQARGLSGDMSAADECTGKYGFSPSTLSALGYRDQVLSMAMTIRDEKMQYSLDFDVSMAEMWDMNARINLDGNVMNEMAKGLAYQPRLREMHIEFTDLSLNERVARYCKQRGLSDAETMNAQIDAFKFVGQENGIEFDQYMIDPYREFLMGKSTLVVTAKPNNPIAFSQIDLYKPEDVPALLNLAAVAR